MAAVQFSSLQNQKCINLATFRKSGQEVRTPVWFAGESAQGVPDKLYVYSTADSGKAKRIRNNGRVRVAPCDMRGKLQGDWIEARAEVVNGQEAQKGMRLLNQKYFPWKQILGLFAFFFGKQRIVFVIRPA